MAILNNEAGRYASFFVQECREPVSDPEFRRIYEGFAHRILWMDGNVVPGAFQMNTSWYSAVPERDPIFAAHAHDADELIGFYSSDPENPYDLGAEIEFSIDGEAHLLTRSTMVFVPANVEHGPLRILRVDRPVFHFSVLIQDHYDSDTVYR